MSTHVNQRSGQLAFPVVPAEVNGAHVSAPSALETDFPAVLISRIAEQESWRKEIHRPATHTHKWWAQRLGSVFRGILAAAVTADRASAEVAYNGSSWLDGLTVYDPFAGSGTTLVEAAKAGGTVVGWDINPVATLVQRQALQAWDINELLRAYKQVEEQCRHEIDRLHKTETGETVLYYFWVAKVVCLECDEVVRLFSDHVFAHHVYPSRYPRSQAVCPVCLDIQETVHSVRDLTCSRGHHFERSGAVKASRMTCPNGHLSLIVDALRGKPPALDLYAKLVLSHDGAKRYEVITDYDRYLYNEAVDLLDHRHDLLTLPRGKLAKGYNTRQALRWGYIGWSDFFNARQLYSLGLLGTAIRELDAAPNEREALAALFSGVLEFNNLFCSFKGEGTGAVRHMFSHHVLKPERTPLEAHPWGTPASSGSFSTLFRSRLLRAHEYKVQPFEQVLVAGEVKRRAGLSMPLSLAVADRWPAEGLHIGEAYVRTGDSSSTDMPTASIDLVVTDPPFMDNVHYSELADFFHVWLREIVPHKCYPSLLESTRDDREVQNTDPDEFGNTISAVWRECRRVMKTDGLLAFTFHQARMTGWLALVKALCVSDFTITEIQPVKAEMSSSVTKGAAAEPSNLDAIVVCRARGFGKPYAVSAQEAEFKCERALEELINAGIPVGVGDARSVARGSVLSLFVNFPDLYTLENLVAVADEATDRIIAKLCFA